MLKTVKMQKYIKLIKVIKPNIRKFFKSESEARSTFDDLVNGYLTVLIIQICNFYKLDITKIRDITQLTEAIYGEVTKSKKFDKDKAILAEWLNTRTFPFISNMVRFNVSSSTVDSIHVRGLCYIDYLTRKDLVDPVMEEMRATAIVYTSDKFANIIQAVIGKNANDIKETGHEFDPVDGLIH